MRYKLWLLLLLIVAVGATVGASARHLKRRFVDAPAAPVAAAPSAASAGPVGAPVEARPSAAPATVAPPEKKERWATGYVFWHGEVLVTDSDGKTWSSDVDTIAIHRGSVVVNGERLFLMSAPVVLATAQTTVERAETVAAASPAPAKDQEGASAGSAVHPEWEDRGGVLYLKNRDGLR